MNYEIVPAELAKMKARIDDLTIDECVSRFWELVGLTGQHYVEMALLAAKVEEQGGDLSEFPLIHQLRKISKGGLLPELVASWGYRTSLIKRLSCLPMEDQERIVGGKRVSVVILDDSGKRAVKKKAMKEIVEGGWVGQVFDLDHIRTEGEQHHYLDQQNVKTKAPPPEKVAGVLVDRERAYAHFPHRMDISLDDLKAIVRALQKPRRRVGV